MTLASTLFRHDISLMPQLRPLLGTVLLWIATTPHSQAAPVKVGHVSLELVSEMESIRPGQPFSVALRFQTDPSWHINWRNPGDAGLPPSVKWELPPGFEAGELQWPLPERLVVPPLASYGYEGTVLLITEITPPDVLHGDVNIAAHVDWLVCSDVCIPGYATVELALPATDSTPQVDPAHAFEFTDTRFRLPITAPDWIVSARLTDESIHLDITPPAWWQGDLGEVFYLPYASDQIAHNGIQTLKKTESSFELTIPRATNNPVAPSHIAGLLVSSTGWRGEGSERGLDIDIVPGEAKGSGAAGQSNALWAPLLFAFLGGMILNLMPCVLPVLSIKVLSLVQAAGSSHRAPVSHSLLYTAGILVSFWILAGLLLALRGAGEALGWGFQLQAPLFVLAMAGVFFLLGLSLMGVFEVGTSWMGLGSGSSRTDGLGTFNSGILAVVVATPCTAPFMGSALGFALTQPAYVALLVFTALGLGLALPYVVLASSPALLRFVPRPGPWMETLKQVLGFLLFATVIWLAWVLGNQAGPQAVAVLLSMLLILAIAAWIWGRFGALSQSDRSRRLAKVAGAALLILAAAWGARGVTLFGATPQSAAESELWQPFHESELERLVNSGVPVLVDFTADWCLSCKVNEQVALSSEDVQERVRELGIVLMKADWTLRNEDITKALAKFGRSSVPLYVLYAGTGPDQFRTLPEILTPGIVLDAFETLDHKTPTTGGTK